MTTPLDAPAARPDQPADGSASARTVTPARVSTGVVIIMLITMFASCSAANAAREAASNSANRSIADTSGLATTEEVLAMCRLLGAVAAKQGTNVAAVFEANQTGTECEQVAAESSASRP